MKKVFSVLFVFVMIFLFFGCAEEDTYEQDKAAILQTMNELTTATTVLGNEILRVGNVTGAQYLFMYLQKVLTIETLQDYLDEIANDNLRKTWEEFTDALFGTFLREAQHMNQTAVTTQEKLAVEKFVEYSQSYKQLKKNVTDKYSLITTEIKTFKETYGEKHAEGVELIVEYYMICSEYAEYIMSPDCTLVEYADYLDSYPEEMEQLLKRIELT